MSNNMNPLLAHPVSLAVWTPFAEKCPEWKSWKRRKRDSLWSVLRSYLFQLPVAFIYHLQKTSLTCTPVNLRYIFRTPFAKNTPGRLLLYICISKNFHAQQQPFYLAYGYVCLFRHCVKSVQIRSYFWSVFTCIRTKYGYLHRKSLYSVRIQENTDQK